MVLDFRATCYLLESFIAYRMQIPAHDFTREVSKYVNYPQSNKVDVMAVASSYLVYCGRNDIGQRDSCHFTWANLMTGQHFL